MDVAAAMARAGNRILSFMVSVMIIIMLLYGGYSIWDSYTSFNGAFVSNDLLEFKPPVNKTEKANPTLSELQKINPDVCAWLTIDDTNIDYPVVQGVDDMEYINKNVYGEYEMSGSIFLSYMNSRDFSDSYNLLYGHHMANGAMFGDVVKFMDRDYFKSHPTGTLYLPNETYRISVFACMSTDAYDRRIFNPPSQQGEEFSAFLSYVQDYSSQYRNIGVDKNDRVVALSTCSNAATYGRIVLFGRLEAQ